MSRQPSAAIFLGWSFFGLLLAGQLSAGLPDAGQSTAARPTETQLATAATPEFNSAPMAAAGVSSGAQANQYKPQSKNKPLKPFIAGVFGFAQSQGRTKPFYTEQILGAALIEHGYALELRYFPGRRLPIELNSGAIDSDLSQLRDLSLLFDHIIRIPEPIRKPCVLAYRLTDNPQQITADKTLRVGLYVGAPDGDKMMLERWPEAQLMHFENIRQGTLQLMNGRIDIITLGALQLPALLANSTRPLTLVDSFPLPYTYLHIHERHGPLADKLAASMKRLKQQYPEPQCAQ